MFLKTKDIQWVGMAKQWKWKRHSIVTLKKISFEGVLGGLSEEAQREIFCSNNPHKRNAVAWHFYGNHQLVNWDIFSPRYLVSGERSIIHNFSPVRPLSIPILRTKQNCQNFDKKRFYKLKTTGTLMDGVQPVTMAKIWFLVKRKIYRKKNFRTILS